MPTNDAILSGLTTLANEWRALAVGWHVLFGILLLTPVLARRPSNRPLGYLLAVPLFSVSALAWTADNPFNGTVFSALALLLLVAARRFSNDSIQCGFGPIAVTGAVLLAVGWSYPHFLQADHWTAYLYAAPLGILPCPTLSALVGYTLVFGLYRSIVWVSALTATSLFYGVIGVFTLRVELDYALLAGAMVLAVQAMREFARRYSVRARQEEHTDCNRHALSSASRSDGRVRGAGV